MSKKLFAVFDFLNNLRPNSYVESSIYYTDFFLYFHSTKITTLKYYGLKVVLNIKSQSFITFLFSITD